MNTFNQTNQDSINANNQINLDKNEKFRDSVNNMRLMMWNKFLLGKANNPEMTKKQICEQMGLKVGTINSIQNIITL
jgi:hypothetical protein